MTTILKDGRFQSSPSGFKVRGQSYASIEEAANSLRPQLPKAEGKPFHLDCKKIFEVSLPSAGYQYRTVAVNEIGDCVAFTIPEERIVVLREDVYEILQDDGVFGRSTVIHEMSHLALQHHLTLHRGATVGKHNFYEDSEWQAKALTAALMMPVDAARTAQNPEELALMCGTSVEAATYRIKNLKRYQLL